MAAALADDFRELFLSVGKAAHQFLIAGSFFHGVEVRALDIFYDGDLKRFRIAELAHNDGDFVKLGKSRSDVFERRSA